MSEQTEKRDVERIKLMLTNLCDRNIALRVALINIRNGDIPRPVTHHYRVDGKPSKNDYCTHGAHMKGTCGACIDEYINSVLDGEAS